MNLQAGNDIEYMKDTRKFSFYPYANNGGTSVAIAGDDFVMIASDTRLTRGYNIYSREQSKCFKLNSTNILAASGCWADILALTKILEARLTMYSHEHHEEMTTSALSQLLSTMLYSRRFFPYYVSNILAGLDSSGKGVVYSYDPVGHKEQLKFSAAGPSVTLIQPFLDNQIAALNMKDGKPPVMTKILARQIIYDCFVSAAEREITTGDAVVAFTITKDGIEEERFDLRKD